MSEIYEVLSPGGHEVMATSIFTYIKNYIDTHGPGSKVDRAGDTMTGRLTINGIAADSPLVVRGISGNDGSGAIGDLHLNYGNDYCTKFGKTANGLLNSNGSINFNGGATTGSLTFNKVNNAIYYNGQYASYPMIKFFDGNDVNGNGISVGGGGAVCIGGGESSNVLAQQLSSGGSEVLYLGNDNSIDFFSNLQNGWASRRHAAFNTNGSLVFDDNVAANIIVPARSISYIQGNNGNAGIYAKKTINTDSWYPVVCMDTKAGGSWAIGNYNNEHLQFSYATKANRDSGTNSTSIMYMQAGDTGRILTTSNYSSYCAASSHTHSYAGSGSAGGSATNADKLLGFSSRSTSQGWGIQTGTVLTSFSDSNSGAWGFRTNCPSSGKLSSIIDGYYYQNEGNYRCLDTSDISGIYSNQDGNKNLTAGTVVAGAALSLPKGNYVITFTGCFPAGGTTSIYSCGCVVSTTSGGTSPINGQGLTNAKYINDNEARVSGATIANFGSETKVYCNLWIRGASGKTLSGCWAQLRAIKIGG